MNNYLLKRFFLISTRKFLAVILCIVLLPALIIPDFATGTTQDKLDEASARLTELRQQQQSLSDDFAALNAQMDEISGQLALIEDNILTRQTQIDTLNSEIAGLNIKKEKQYSAMKLRIKYMYENTSDGVIEYMLNAESISEALNRAEFFRSITEYNQNMLYQLNDTLQSLNEHSISLNNELIVLNNLKEEAKEQSDNIKSLIASTQVQLNASDEDIAYFEQLCLEYEAQLEAEKTPPEPVLPEPVLPDSDSSNTQVSPPSYIDTPQTPSDYDSTDLDMLAAILECEGGTTNYEGLCAIASVIINRVNSPRFDNSISGVINSPGQFSPVKSGRFALVLARGAKPICYQAAQHVLDGNITIDALYFRTYRDENDLVDGIKIGSNVFFKTWHK